MSTTSPETRARFAQLAAEARLRREQAPTYPDSPEAVQEAQETAEGFVAGQAASL